MHNHPYCSEGPGMQAINFYIGMATVVSYSACMIATGSMCNCCSTVSPVHSCNGDRECESVYI